MKVESKINTDFNMKVCIIILNWNGYNDTVKCIKSIQHVRNVPNRIVVVDNGSIYNDVSKLKKKFRHQIDLYKLKNNIGFSAGINFGIQKGSRYNPEYYLLLNNDTLVEENFLFELVKVASTQKKIGLLSPVILSDEKSQNIWFSGGDFNPLLARPIHIKEKPSSLVLSKFLSGCALLIKSDVIRKVGLFDERFFAYFEDMAYCHEVIKEKIYVCLCPFSNNLSQRIIINWNKK